MGSDRIHPPTVAIAAFAALAAALGWFWISRTPIRFEGSAQTVWESVEACAQRQKNLYLAWESYLENQTAAPDLAGFQQYAEQTTVLWSWLRCPMGKSLEGDFRYRIFPENYGNPKAVFIAETQNRHPNTLRLSLRGIRPDVQTMGDGTIHLFHGGKVATTQARPRGSSRPFKVPPPATGSLELIAPSPDGTHFVRQPSGEPFLAWGFNYDHDHGGRLLEDYWTDEWTTVESDFQEMKDLGANVVRIHLQVGRFMNTPHEPDPAALQQLTRLVQLAETTGLYLDLTGLGCYHKQDVPAWYDRLSESNRWITQAKFWEAIAQTCAGSPAVFCYDLMNEPILPGSDQKETEWLAGEFAGKHFVQRIALDLAGRTREEVAEAWVTQLAAAIRRHDPHHMITVGIIPWAYTFPGAQPIFYAPEVGRHLDFVSVHFYPKHGDHEQALQALAVYDLGKPLVVEEMFPLQCRLEELDRFIASSRHFVDGWISFYWGRTVEDYGSSPVNLPDALMKSWLQYCRTQGPALLRPRTP